MASGISNRATIVGVLIFLWLVCVVLLARGTHRRSAQSRHSDSSPSHQIPGYTESPDAVLPRITHTRAKPVLVVNASVFDHRRHGDRAHSSPSDGSAAASGAPRGSAGSGRTNAANEREPQPQPQPQPKPQPQSQPQRLDAESDTHGVDEEDHAHGEPEVEVEALAEAHIVPVLPIRAPAPGSDRCADDDFGAALLRRWVDAGQDYCAGGASRIRCFRITQARHAGPDNFCVMENVVFSPASNELIADCRPTSHADGGGGQLRRDLFPPHMMSWLDMLRLRPLPSEAVPVADPDETTVLAWRDCAPPYNPFHCYGDPFNLYLELHMFQLNPEHVRVLFLDDAPAGVWLDMWRTMAQSVLARAEWRAALGSQPVRLRHVVTNISPGSNFIWKDFWHPTPCPHPSPLLTGFAEHLSRGLGLDAHGVHPPNRIVVSLRTPTDRLRNNPHAVKRLLVNEAELLHELRRAFPALEVVGVDTGTLDFRAQVELLHSASLLVGVHGAGMTLMLYMQRRGTAVVELFPHHPPNDGKPRCYENMAAWLGLPYVAWDNSDPTRETSQGMRVDVPAIVQAAREALQRART